MNIVITELNKIYGKDKHVLRDINLEISTGIFGLLGPNGAGKTTLMRILVTLLKPTSGKVMINGYDLSKNRKEIRAMLGYLPQDFHLFGRLRTWEFLDYSARLAGLKSRSLRNKAIEDMLENVGLFEVRDRMANKLSGGMKRRLGIAQALIGDPKLIIVDEPTTGLDPEERIRFRNLLSDISQKDTTVILSTHIVGDISSTCSNLVLLSRGEVVFNGSPEELVNKAKNATWQIVVADEDLETVKTKYPVISTIPTDIGWEVQIVAEEVNEFSACAIEPTLEHAYVYYMEGILEDEVGLLQ